MAIYKRGKTYWYEFQFNGQRIQQSAQTGNREAARQIESAHRVRLAKGEAGIEAKPPTPTLKQFSKQFMEQIEMDCASKPATVDFYRRKLDLLLKRLGAKALDKIDVKVIEEYKRARARSISRHKKKLSPASINRELATLRRLLKMAYKWKLMDRLPEIKLLRGEGGREFVLSREDESKYLDALPGPMRELAAFMIDSGLRVGEVLKLEWPSVNLREHPGHVRILALHSKNSKPRAVPLTPRARQILCAKPERFGLVFRNAEGGPLYHTWLDQQHAAIRKALKLPNEFVLHSLRHTFGTRLGETGADAFTIMRLMGHTTVTVSQKYVHPTSESMTLAIERLSALPAKAPTALKVVGGNLP